MRPTLASVAEQAQVSRQTVSNVLNAPHLVRPETSSRVRAVIDAVGYRPYHAARALRTQRSRLIGVRMVPGDDLSRVVGDRFLHAVTAAGEHSGYRTLLFTATDDADEITSYDDLLATHDMDAFVLTGTHHGDTRSAWLSERSIAYVSFGRPWGSNGQVSQHSWVDVDGACGTAEATDLLLAAGHSRIAFVGWPSGSGVGDDRRSGWARAMAARLGREAPADLVATQPNSLDGGAEAARSLLGSANPPTAFVCASDSLALGVQSVVQALLEPATQKAASGGTGEAPIIGFDDTPVAAARRISSIAQPLVEAADACLRILTSMLDRAAGSADGAPEHVLLPPRLILRRPLLAPPGHVPAAHVPAAHVPA